MVPSSIQLSRLKRVVPDRELRWLAALPAAAAGTGASTVISLLGERFADRALLLGPYVPALFLVSLWGGRACGRFMVALNILVISGLFLRNQPPAVFVVSLALVVLISLLTYASAVALRSSILALTARERALMVAHEEQDLLVRELNHRVKNMLTVVQSLATLTLRGASDLQMFRGQFEDRLAGLGRAQSALISGGWSRIELAALLSEVLAPFESPVPDEGLKLTCGPPVTISSDLAIALALVMHELATNASKYGALRLEGGSVACGWTRSETGGVQLEWRERNIAPLKAMAGTGFGTELVSRLLGRFGRCEVRMEPDGLYFALEFTDKADEPAPRAA